MRPGDPVRAVLGQQDFEVDRVSSRPVLRQLQPEIRDLRQGRQADDQVSPVHVVPSWRHPVQECMVLAGALDLLTSYEEPCKCFGFTRPVEGTVKGPWAS